MLIMKGTGFFSFTKKERTGIIALIFLLVFVTFFSGLFPAAEPEISFPEKEIAQLFPGEKKNDTMDVRHAGRSDPRYETFTGNNAYQKIHQPRNKKRSLAPVEVNTADTALFIALPGIGSKLAARIVMFRQRLGGFCNVRQIGEVYGLHDSVFTKISPFLKCDSTMIEKINVNTASKDVLKAHPYIRWKIAEALVTYRNEHGNFRSKYDLVKIENIDTIDIKRILPYLSF